MDLGRVLNTLGMNHLLSESFVQSQCKILHFDPRQILFKKGELVESIYLILFGSVRFQSNVGSTSEESESNSVIYAFKGAGSLLGIFAYLEKSHRHAATAVIMENTSVLQIPVSAFLNEVENHPPLREEVHRQIANNFKELQFDREVQRSCTSVRLAHFLVRTLESQKDFKSRSIMMKLTKKDLAKRIGSEPETVVRLLSDWGQKGIIKNKNRMIEICNMEELSKLIGR